MDHHIIHIFDSVAKDIFVKKEVASDDERSSQGSDDDTGGAKKSHREMSIILFGSKPDGTPVRVHVEGFRPFFFVSVPGKLKGKKEVETYITHVQAIASSTLDEDALASLQIIQEQKKKLYGFSGDRQHPVLRLEVGSIHALYALRRAFLNEYQRPSQSYKGSAIQVFESNLDPMLRFFHMRNLAPCGWIDCGGGSGVKEVVAEDGTTCYWSCSWDSIDPVEKPPRPSAPFKLAAWDIECYSNSGDFPVAQASWVRVAKELWKVSPCAAAVPELIAEWFTRSGSATGAAGYIPTPPPALRSRRAPTYLELNDLLLVPATFEQLEAVFGVTAGVFHGKAGKEKEELCAQIAGILQRAIGRVVSLAGDPIIQIGTVLVQGEETERHIFVLGGCDAIEGATVYECETERDLLAAWGEWIQEVNPDIMVGYNIFGFDEKYVWDRMIELGLCKEGRAAGAGAPRKATAGHVEPSFAGFTRLQDQGGAFKLEKKFLSSSALGDNTMYLWTTPGRLRIDLYHHVKRKQVLPSYKLDAVCATFLSGKLTGLERRIQDGNWLLLTKQKGDARVGRSVVLLDELGEELSEKLEIVEIVKEGLVVRGMDEFEGSADDAVQWAVVKDDVSPAEIFRLHRGSDADRARVAAYCIQDCELVVELYKKLDVFNEAMSMANVCSVPVTYIFTRGQGIKIESLIFKDCYERGQVVEVLPSAPFRGDGATDPDEDGAAGQDDSYEGAIVLDPVAGMYFDAPVGVCDFASLYPSTIISENISYDSLVWVKEFDLKGVEGAPAFTSEWGEAPLPAGWRYTDISFDILRPDPEDKRKHPVNKKMGTRVCRYAQPPGDGKSTLPQIVQKLLSMRKTKRKMAEKENDPFRKALLDAEQLAYKLTANSLYGQLGSGTFKVRLQHLAASVTAYGRKQILFAKDAIEKFYGPAAGNPLCCASGAEVVYGDSVTGDTALWIRRGAGAAPLIVRIDELEGVWSQWHESKEAFDGAGLEVWTERGWTAVRRVIRHRLAPTKRLFRILTHTGVVDCTEDHSLVLSNGTECKPSDVTVGTPLLHNFEIADEFGRGDGTLSVEEAWDIGYNLSEKEAEIPTSILNGSLDCVKGCMDGVFASYDVNSAATTIVLEYEGKVLCSALYILARRLGYSVLLDADGSRFRLTLSRDGPVPSCEIKSISEMNREGVEYVYDMETENHHFGVGPGALIVHNTDSLFVCFNPKNPATGEPLKGREAIVATIELTEEAGKFISSALKPPHDFEYDKVFAPFIIFSKKRYVGNKYEDSPDKFKQTSMGIVLKRRDNAPLLKVIYGGAVDLLLNHQDIAAATRFVQDQCREMVDGKTKLSLLTISMSLRAEYNTPSPPKHKVLADRMAARDPGNAPAPGDRIPYVYVAAPLGQQAAKLQGDRIESPAYVKEKGLRPDVRFYIEHQLMNPLSQLFSLCLEKMPGYEGAPRGGWAQDADKRAAQREEMASAILFSESLGLCNAADKRSFVSAFFGGGVTDRCASNSSHKGSLLPAEAGSSDRNPTTTDRIATAPVKKPRSSKTTVEPPKQQTPITAYFGDARLAREMRAVKRSVAVKKATASASAAAKEGE
jgi:DNA polymerase elongation subunit (family B)